MNRARSNAPAQLPAQPEQRLTTAHLQEQNLSLSVDVLDVDKDNNGDNSDAESGADEAAEQEESLGTPIDPQFWPCENHITVCAIDGADAETIKREVEGFIATHQERGTFSQDWNASWTMWWKRWKDHRDALAAKAAKQAKPRVEVSSRYAPTDEEWQRACQRFAKDGSGWSRQFGPEPGMRACRCPQNFIIEAGMDPATGLKTEKA
jgi:hypothetical protein